MKLAEAALQRFTMAESQTASHGISSALERAHAPLRSQP